MCIRDRSTVVVDGMILEDNNQSGAFVFDSRYVVFSNLSSTGNDEAGLYYYLSNDLESSSGDVVCSNCVSIADQRGIIIRDSVDLSTIKFIASGESSGGIVFGIAQTRVNPPANAAREPVSKVSLSS